MGKAWDRKKGEGTQAFEAFQEYRNMRNERSTDKVRESTGKSIRLIERWSSEHDWVARVHQYDDHLDKIGQLEFENEHKRIARRQAKLGKLMQDKGEQALQTYCVSEATLDQIVRLLKTGVDIERTATGEPTSIEETRNTHAVLILPDNGTRDNVDGTTDIPTTARATDRVPEE